MFFYIKKKIRHSQLLSPIYKKLKKIRDNYISKRDAEYLQKNGLEALLLVKKVLNEQNIEFWLDTSTLLGAIREKNFIKGDNDLGIGIELKNYSKVLEDNFKKNGIKLLREFSIDNKKYGLEQTYMYKGVEIDIFYHTRFGNKTKYHSFIFNEDTPREYTVKEATFPFEGLMDFEFLGEIFKIPKNYKEYTAVKYGDDYMTPNPKWTMADEKNTIILKNKVGKFRGK